MHQPLPILYSFRRCPYAMRARMAIWCSGIAVELREIKLQMPPAQMLQVSPKATVPVLVLPNHVILEESMDIMHWALAKNDPESWWQGLDAHLRKTAADLIYANDYSFKPDLDRYKYPDRYADVVAIEYRARGGQFLHRLEDCLSDHEYLLGEQRGIADIAIFPFIRQFAHVDRDWFYRAPYPRVQTWLDKLLESGLFARVMQKYAVWNPVEQGVLFGA